MEEYIKCKICCFIFNTEARKPVILACGHTFCLACILQRSSDNEYFCLLQCNEQMKSYNITLNGQLLDIVKSLTFQQSQVFDYTNDMEINQYKERISQIQNNSIAWKKKIKDAKLAFNNLNQIYEKFVKEITSEILFQTEINQKEAQTLYDQYCRYMVQEEDQANQRLKIYLNKQPNNYQEKQT